MVALASVLVAGLSVAAAAHPTAAPSTGAAGADVHPTGLRTDYGTTSVAIWPDERLGVLSFTHDDNRADHYNIAGPALAARGLTGTFYVNPGFPDWATKGPHYAQMAAQGHELGSHTMFHQHCVIKTPEQDPGHSYFWSLAELAQDCANIKAVLDLLQPGRTTLSFAYPYGDFEAQTRQLLSTQFLSCRRSVDGLHVNPPTLPNSTLLMPSMCGSSSGSAWADYSFTYTMLTACMQAAMQQGGWVVEEYHDVQWPGYDGVNLQGYYDHLDDVADAVAAGQLWVATVGDAMRYMRSRDAAVIALMTSSPGEIDLNADDQLDDVMYNVPVTLRTRIPMPWLSTVKVIVNGQLVPSHVTYTSQEAYVHYSVVLGTPTIVISAMPLESNRPVLNPQPQPNTHP